VTSASRTGVAAAAGSLGPFELAHPASAMHVKSSPATTLCGVIDPLPVLELDLRTRLWNSMLRLDLTAETERQQLDTAARRVALRRRPTMSGHRHADRIC
jgi:hypothetical protein